MNIETRTKAEMSVTASRFFKKCIAEERAATGFSFIASRYMLGLPWKIKNNPTFFGKEGGKPSNRVLTGGKLHLTP